MHRAEFQAAAKVGWQSNDKGLSIAWQQVPYAAGGWSDWDAEDPEDAESYRTLLGSDRGRFYVVGDQVSPLPAGKKGR